jgi:hypothetical protein
MKKYNLTERWENDKPINTFDFDTLDELQQIDIVKKAIQHPNFHRLSIRVGSVLSYYPPNYSTFTLLTELHDGYVYEELGFLTKNPFDKFNYGFPSNAKTPPVVCLNFNPIKELGVADYDYYNSKIYNLIGANGAWLIADMFAKGVDIDTIKKVIDHEIEYQQEHPESRGPLIKIPSLYKK